MRTLWVCEVTGGPFRTIQPLSRAKPTSVSKKRTANLKISPAEFDEVAAELGRSLDFAKVPAKEKQEVLAAFAAHKDEVTAGYPRWPEPATGRKPPATVPACLSRFRDVRICHRLPLVAPARLHKRSVLSAQEYSDEKTDSEASSPRQNV